MYKVLFVCSENRKRSQLAEVIFNYYAKNAQAQSGGTNPVNAVDDRVRQVLEEMGIEHEELKSKRVKKEDLDSADLIVSFGCLAPSMFPANKFLEWHIDDPQTIEDFRKVRDQLKEKIAGLIEGNR